MYTEMGMKYKKNYKETTTIIIIIINIITLKKKFTAIKVAWEL